MVEEEGTYKLENVMVGFNEGNYKLLPHRYKLNMMGNATFTKVNASNVPQNVFEFMSFKDILISPEEDVVAGMKSYLLVIRICFFSVYVNDNAIFFCCRCDWLYSREG